MVSNVAAPMNCALSCSDASLARGAVCSTLVEQPVGRQRGRRVGKLGCRTLIRPGKMMRPPLTPFLTEVRALLSRMNYDFIEVRLGGPWASSHLSSHLCVGPVLDARASPFFRLIDRRCLEWVLCLLQARRLRSVLLLPPVGFFSPACPSRPTTRSGETRRVLLASLAVLLVACRCGAPAALMHPLLSRARGLPSWQNLLRLRGHSEFFFGGCDAFSRPLGPTVFLAGPAFDPAAPCLARLVSAKACATARAVAACFREALRDRPASAPPASGLEAVLLNDIMVSRRWQTESSWAWREKSHINILEGRAYVRLLRLRAATGEEQRFVHGLDSNVALGAFLKGRTSSRRPGLDFTLDPCSALRG